MRDGSFRSGFIGIVGRPNVGKSTLLNAILKEKIAIITDKPQTTRNRITGIKNLPDGQLIFIDTPGIHPAKSPLNKAMVAEAFTVFTGVDVILLIIEAPRGFLPGDKGILNKSIEAGLPILLVINKTDLTSIEKVRSLLEEARQFPGVKRVIPISAIMGEGIDQLIFTIKEMLPEGSPYFPPDILTDRSERFIAAEIIREKIMLHTQEEVPYSTAVTVEAFKEDEKRNLIKIEATITVERESQKKILIGRGGNMLKKIGSEARIELERFFATRVFLSLFVRVRKDWSKDEKWLKEFGYKR